MFLNALEKDDHKFFFLRLARLLALAEGDLEGFKDSVAWKSVGTNIGAFYERFISAMMSSEEEVVFGSYAKELGVESLLQKNSYYENQAAIKEEFIKAMNMVLDGVKDNKDLKKQVIENLVKCGVDITEIDQNVIKAQLLFIDDVRKAIVFKTAELVLPGLDVSKSKCGDPAGAFFGIGGNLFSAYGLQAAGLLPAKEEVTINHAGSSRSIDELTAHQKRVIIFELIGLAQADGEFGEMERAVISNICDFVGVEQGFVDDVADVVKQITKSTREAIDLISE